MTEQEAIEIIKIFPTWNLDDRWLSESEMEELSETVITALEEIQQYRALEAIEKLKSMKESALSGIELANIWAALEKLKKYEAIGTVEELREAREKQFPKKPKHILIHHGKHRWRRQENGEIDESAWEYDYHNGVACEICGKTVCVCCNPEYDQLTDCKEEYWICPNCQQKVHLKHCNCGQAIDWSD